MLKLAELISHLTAGIWAGLWPGIRLSPQWRAYTWALQRGKSISPLFPGPVGVVINDWCITSAGLGLAWNQKPSCGSVTMLRSKHHTSAPNSSHGLGSEFTNDWCTNQSLIRENIDRYINFGNWALAYPQTCQSAKQCHYECLRAAACRLYHANESNMLYYFLIREPMQWKILRNANKNVNLYIFKV